MAEAKKPVDPFEAFKQKKAAEAARQKEAARVDEANKASGWIDGIGPAEENEDPNKPKGFVRGRYAKPETKPEELAKLRPKGLDPTQLAKPKPTDPKKLSDVDKRRPGNYERY